jgi:DNA-binding transcriptional MocR family regulator
MSIQAVSWVLKHSEAQLGARLVLISIANHADADGSNAFPSVGSIAAETRMSERQVQRAICTLERQGHLTVRRGEGRHGTHLFMILRMGDNMSGDILSGEATNQVAEKPEQARNVTRTLSKEERKKESPPTPPRGAGVDDSQFEAFWRTYPRREDKGHARKAYAKSVKGTPADVILEAAKRYAALRNGEDPKYTALAATWLNGERWSDEAAKPNGKSLLERYPNEGVF